MLNISGEETSAYVIGMLIPVSVLMLICISHQME